MDVEGVSVIGNKWKKKKPLQIPDDYSEVKDKGKGTECIRKGWGNEAMRLSPYCSRKRFKAL